MRERIRRRLAQEAARIMVEEGVHEYLPAKQKAAARLGVADSRSLPRNEEIDEALQEYHRLYRAQVQPEHITRLRQLALEAMRFLRQFSPRLIGAVLDGSAGPFAPISLHLFPEAPEDVCRTLTESGIPFVQKSMSINLGSQRPAVHPVLLFFVDGTEVRLFLLPPAELKQQRALRRDKGLPKGTIERVEALLGSDGPGVSGELGLEP